MSKLFTSSKRLPIQTLFYKKLLQVTLRPERQFAFVSHVSTEAKKVNAPNKLPESSVNKCEKRPGPFNPQSRFSNFVSLTLHPNYVDTVMSLQKPKPHATLFLTMSRFPSFLSLALEPRYEDTAVIYQKSLALRQKFSSIFTTSPLQ